MKLISGTLSNNAAKVRLVLAEKDVDHEVVEVAWTRQHAWQPKPPLLLDTNPRAQVPVLIDDDLTLWDSTVISEYLEEQYPSPALLPADIRLRAVCRLWEDEGDYNQMHVGVLIQDVFMAAADTPMSAAAVTAVAELEGFFERLDHQLSDNDYICGAFSIADISVYLTCWFAMTLGAQARGQHMAVWLERMAQRPAVKAQTAAILAAIAALD